MGSSLEYNQNKSSIAPNIDSFSKNLFWDVDQTTFNPTRNKRWLFRRVIEYGTLDDWRIIFKNYGILSIADELKQVRSLEPRALNFIARLSNTPLKDFECYKRRFLSRKHWIY